MKNKENYILIGDESFYILEKELSPCPTAIIQNAYVSVCSGPKEKILKYIEDNNIPRKSIKGEILC